MEVSIDRAKSHLQSITVKEAARQYHRLQSLIETIYSEIEKISMEIDDLSQTIIKGVHTSATEAAAISRAVGNNNIESRESKSGATSNGALVGDAIDDSLLKHDDSDEATAEEPPEPKSNSDIAGVGIHQSINLVLNTIQVRFKIKYSLIIIV